MEIIDGIPVWGTEIDQAALKQIKTCYYIFGQAAMMADHHKGYGVPIGGVIAHENLVSPSGVGYDIGCGNKAVLTDADPRDVRRNIATIMDDVWNAISFGVGRKNASPVEHELFDDDNDPAWSIHARREQRHVEADEPKRSGARAARHRGLRESLCGHLRR